MPEVSKETRALILRSNRFLANSLSEHDLVTDEDVEEANEKLLEAVDSGNLRQMSVLNILIYELKKLEEKDYIDFLLKERQIGLIALRNYRPRPIGNEMNDPEKCWATWTVPFDLVGDYYLVATAYYLSQPVIDYWEKIADKPIVWYATTIESVTETIDRLADTDSAETEGVE